jgi:creatinine amidohydrolase/Fe(II)-dependent formamide hydrolase-like protein
MRGRKDALAVLEAITRLEVGPVHLERDRLTASYLVVQGRKKDTFELIYRYEEEVFPSGDPDCLNMGAMIAAQVAMNYGLFCREIVFRGPYDATDRKFILEMMENTAREIYVKKFLEPNPFLIGPASRLPVVKKKSYMRAKVSFSGDGKVSPKNDKNAGQGIPAWDTERSRHAVLSSGGKDSLTSFGLLRELGREVHPIFVNESGRHWFTALNAFRYFSKNFPETARVWTNADRLFNWMLRHFPFVRQDFANIRSDEYAIRLWTVAVFLFGALPLLRARKIGRIIIGDEFDTTRRLSHKGITHYDGLFDQSRYFDNALTRFYRRKGWSIEQFSIIRPLSELLVEKLLTERYPELLRHQVSCHAAHTEGDRVHPCGRCEKCRRIVGMLMAFGADPARCGYKSADVERCLMDLAMKGAHQETGVTEHAIYLLREKGLLPETPGARTGAHRRPEVMKVRVDGQCSPMEQTPPDLRGPLFRIFLEHSEGAARREGRSWVDVDLVPQTDFSPMRKLAGSPPGAEEHTLTAPGARGPERPYLLGELTWIRAKERLSEVDLAILPVGSIEQHGPHLPLDTDAFDANYLAYQVANLCSDPKPLVLPLIPYGISYHHEDFSGTISVSPDTLSRLVYEVGLGSARNGIKKLVIINAHGGNVPALQFASQMINRDAHIFTCVESGETSEADIHSMIETPNDVHAGEVETSTALAARPGLVRLEKARKFVPRFSSRYLNFSTKRSVEWYAKTSKISPSGVLGDPTKASAEKGKRILDLMISHLVEFIEDLKGMTLEEIYQKRY